MKDVSAQDPNGFWAMLIRLYSVVSVRRRRQFYFVIALMIAGAFAELATIGAVLPFLSLLADSSNWERFPWLAKLVDLFGDDSPQGRMMAAIGLFITLAIVSGLLRLQLAWSSQGFIFKLGHELSSEIKRRILLQPYSFHIRTNTSTLIAALEKVHTLVFNVLLPLMQAVTAAFLSIFILAALIYLDPFTATVAAIGFSLIYLLISALTRQRLARNSATLAGAYDERVKIVQESLGGVRDIIIDGSQQVFLDMYRRVDRNLNVARANTAFIAAAPRFVIEALGMVLIAIVAAMLVQREGGIAGAIPILGALALGAQRLLPLLQQIYTGWTSAAGHRSVLSQVLELLALPPNPDWTAREDLEPLPLRDRIVIEHVGFSYSGRRVRALKDVTLEIPRGATVGLIGRTGSGKSTLADLLMGLLEPSEGQIAVDGVPIGRETRQRWWESIAHVPQSIFLADDTIARNIAFGAPRDAIDMARVIEASIRSQLHEYVSGLPGGYETQVGERGVRLSGGQRQRLGIARAIYKQAPVLVLDEATSALDDETEAAVMHALATLRSEGCTTIMIAHRLSTVSRADLVVRLENGAVADIGSYAEVVGTTPQSRVL